MAIFKDFAFAIRKGNKKKIGKQGRKGGGRKGLSMLAGLGECGIMDI